MKGMKSTLATVVGRLIRSERENARLRNEMIDQRSHSMKYNLIINIDKADATYSHQPGDTPASVARKFITITLGLPNAQNCYIPVAHPLNDTTTHRQILVKLPIADQLSQVMSKVNRMQGTNHSLIKQLPAERRERKQFVLPHFKSARSTDQQARLVDDRLYICGQIQKQFQPPVIPDHVSDVSAVDLQVKTSRKLDDSGSSGEFSTNSYSQMMYPQQLI